MMAAAAISLVSCKKEESYVPAEKETGLQVYFSYETPTTYNLSEEGSFTIPIYRNEFSSAATVQITTEADSPLTAPSEVSFASGQNRADIVVSYDFDAIEEGKSYAISFAVANAAETTLYGLSSLKVSASLPSAWIDFLGPDGKPAKVTFTQGHWGEIHTGYIHYTEQADGSRLCETYDEEGDISGDYTEYANTWTQDVNGIEVTCFGNREGDAAKSIWTVDNMYFSIVAEGLGGDQDFGLNAERLTAMVSSIQ